MKAEALLALYERVAEAPDAIVRLQRSVLDLAVRGKLVEQDSADEPGQSLVRRIAEERAKLVASGAVSSIGTRKRTSDEPFPFDLPAHWHPACLADALNEIQTGPFGSSLHQSDYVVGGTPVINPASIQDGKLIPIEKMAVGESTLERLSTFKLRAGDIVMARRGEMGRCALVTSREAGWLCGTGSLVLRPSTLLHAPFVALLIGAPYSRDYLGGSAVGTTMQNLNQAILLSLPLPLPPAREQVRIVAKVDELMALLDRLDAARSAREATRDRLTTASLTRLTAPDTAPETLRTHAHFALDALPALTTRTDQIKQLRQSILDLGIHGSLTQGSSSESSEVGRVFIGPDRREERASDCRATLPLPAGWTWKRLEDLIVQGPQNGLSPRKTDREDAPKAITLTATTSGSFDDRHFKHVDIRPEEAEPYWLQDDDLLFQRGNTPEYVGMAAIYSGPPREYLFPDLMIRVRLCPEVLTRFVHLWCVSPRGRYYLMSNATGAQQTMPKINQGVLKAMPVPVPPLAEQHRIVAKVDELIALCDRLEAALQSADTSRARLLEALLHEALAGERAQAA